MAARPAQASPSMEQFEAYFQRADLDRDGRISGAEAVAFFQGSNLPKNVLAQIWSYSDQKNTSFLGRAEFYNALRLVTVAQSGKQLTPEIVKAALEGPAAAKIPAPRINPVAPVTSVNAMSAPRPQFNNVMPSSTQMGGMPQNTFPNLGVRGSQSQVVPGTGMNQQYMPPSSNQFMRPLQGAFASPSVQMQPVNQGLPGGGSVAGPSLSGSAIPNLSTDWFAARTGGPSAFGTSQFASKGIIASAHQDGFGSSHSLTTNSSMIRPQAMPAPLTPNSTGPLLSSAQPGAQDSKAPVVSGNGFSSAFGGDSFSALKPSANALSSTFSASKVPNSASIASVSISSQNSLTSASVASSSGMPATTVGGSGLQRTQSLAAQNQLDIIPSIAVQPSATGLGVSTSNSTQSEVPWPKMTQSSIQKYTKVFMEVDKDRDGKITGEEARNLFLSWRLPREVLKQVWDLSDQDSDSMLSLSEFCIALYLMERYREGRSLPPMLPNSVKFDDTLVQVTRQSSAGYGGLAWQPGSGMPGARPLMSATALRPQQLAQMPLQIDGQMQPLQQKSTMQVMDKQFGSFGNQFNNEEQNALNSNVIEAAETGGKVKELEKEIMDSKEKLEFYRSKMQDLVLYKSRCDNRLNEIMENASASKREVEELAKRYEEKYKQVGEIASKLTVEEATFRDIQERKLELYNAIVKMEQGGSADGLLQVRADRIQSDLEELAKALNDRCKKRGLDVKSSVIIELPFGWQPGIQEGAVDWDEDWDKFEDEGFILSKELTVDTDNGVASRKSKTSSGTSNEIFDEDTSHSGLSDVNKLEKLSSPGERATESEVVFAQSEDGSARSPSSPLGKNALDSPSREFHPPQFDNHDASPHANDSHSDHGGAESSFFSDGKYGDESSWGATFDANDDTDSIWGFNTSNKEVGHDMHKQNSFFDSGDFGLNPIRTGSPSASSVFGKEKSPFFADSVPGTPSFNAGPSPRYNEERPTFDSFRHFDSFNTQGNLARFDSMRSTTTDFSQGGLFNQRENLARFDSIRSSGDFDRSHGFQSFDDADPFGTGPFKPSESNTPRRASDNWSAF